MAYGGTGVTPSGVTGLTVGSGLVSSGAMIAHGAQTFVWVLCAITLLILGLIAVRVFVQKTAEDDPGPQPGAP